MSANPEVTQADEAREIQISALCAQLPLEVTGQARRDIWRRIEELIAGRSAGMVERIEKARGLRR